MHPPEISGLLLNFRVLSFLFLSTSQECVIKQCMAIPHLFPCWEKKESPPSFLQEDGARQCVAIFQLVPSKGTGQVPLSIRGVLANLNLDEDQYFLR